MLTKREMLDSFFARTDLTEREREALKRLFARANPPPMLYRYRRPNDWALEEITKQRIWAATPDDLNDPFECLAPMMCSQNSLKNYFIDVFAPQRGLSVEQAAEEFDTSFGAISQMISPAVAEIRRQTGIICFTAIPNSVRMWSYYAESHKGICVGFDTNYGPFMAAMKVTYQNPNKPLDLAETLRVDASQLANHITLRKAAEWEFEQEYRIPVGPIGDRPRAFPFPVAAISEIRFGARIEDEFKAKVIKSISHLPHPPRLIQMGCDFERFILTEEIVAV